MTPTPRMLRLASLGLVVAALPVIVDPQLWILLAVLWLALGLMALSDAMWLRRASPQLAVALPRTVGVGESLAAAVVLSRPGRGATGPVAVTLRSEASGVVYEGEDATLVLEAERAEIELPLRAPDRGVGSLDAIWLRLDGRLGLIQRIVRSEVEAKTRVIPSLPAVQRLTINARVGGARVGTNTARGHGTGTEFDELAVYAMGMDTRAIDWKASARHRELRVRRFQPEQNQRVIIALDTGRAMLERIGDLTRLDHAIHTGLALAKVALRNGDQVGMHAYNIRPRAWVRPRAGLSQLRRLAHESAELAADERESNPVHGVRDLMGRLNRRSLVVLLSDLRDPTATELLTEALASLARKHLVVLVALADPETADPLAEEPSDLESITRAMVQHDLARERRLALERLKGRGIHVLSAAPGLAALLVLRRYLDIKKRGRL